MTAVRDATAADLAELVSLDLMLFGANAWSAAAMREELTATGGSRVVLAAEAAGSTVGYAVALCSAEVADLLRIGVVATAQRRGVGSLLLATVTARAAAAGCHRLMLEVDAGAVSALAFYRRHGFTELTRRPAYYRDGADAVVMARPIAMPRPA